MKVEIIRMMSLLEDYENENGIYIAMTDVIQMIEECNTYDEAKQWIIDNI